MFYNDSIGDTILGTLFFGGIWLLGYNKGQRVLGEQIEKECMKSDIEELRAKLAEQNRINAMNRMRT